MLLEGHRAEAPLERASHPIFTAVERGGDERALAHDQEERPDGGVHARGLERDRRGDRQAGHRLPPDAAKADATDVIAFEVAGTGPREDPLAETTEATNERRHGSGEDRRQDLVRLARGPRPSGSAEARAPRHRGPPRPAPWCRRLVAADGDGDLRASPWPSAGRREARGLRGESQPDPRRAD